MNRLTVDGMLVAGIILLVTTGALIAALASFVGAQWLVVALGVIMAIGAVVYAAYVSDFS